MFGSSKKDGFKYESEVKALIREAIDQRFFALETHNQQLLERSISLETEIVQLKNFIVNDLQRLEKRITDFTDVWHPFMIQNINRIKDELVTSIVETERQNIQKFKADLEELIIKDKTFGLSDNILIGYFYGLPVFAHKDSTTQNLLNNFNDLMSGFGKSSYMYQNCELIFENLKYLNQAVYDAPYFMHITLINKDRTIMPESLRKTKSEHHGIIGWDDNFLQTPLLKNLYKLCKKYGIIFKINGQDRVNGVPIKLLFEDI
jgi:hypothetical protein